MIKVIDTSDRIASLFVGSKFDLTAWEIYVNSIYENCAHLFTDDMNECIGTGKYTFERDFLPIINAVNGNPKLDVLRRNFSEVTNGLNERIVKIFGNEIDADVVLYLGLCNGAGWVMDIDGRAVIMLGIEKIIELGWYDLKSLYGLIYHELGHVYQLQYGVLERESGNSAVNFVWQLFTEGIAMCFEQELVGDSDFYHQDINGWKTWCDASFKQIVADFCSDLPEISYSNQRWFGDWVKYCGHGDVGYYLGARFVRELMKDNSFDSLINFTAEEAYSAFMDFTKEDLK